MRAGWLRLSAGFRLDSAGFGLASVGFWLDFGLISTGFCFWLSFTRI